jgi:hypothetical protein
MQSFKDAKDRTWTIAIDPISVDLVRSKHDVDLFEVGAVASHEDPQNLVEWQLNGNPLLFCRVMFELLVDRPADVTFEDFARQIKGDYLQAARNALWEEIVNFTPDPQERRVRMAMQAKLKALMNQGMERIYELIQSPELEERLNGELKRLDATFTSLLDELGSTGIHCPTALRDGRSPDPARVEPHVPPLGLDPEQRGD